MKCGVVYDLLPLYLEHVCSEESSGLVEEHLKECGRCQDEMRRLKKEYTVEFSDVSEEADIEKMAERGKKNLKRRIKMDMMDKAVAVDLVINILLQILFVQWGRYKGVIWFINNPIPFILFMALVIWSIWEVVYLVKKFRRQVPFISVDMSVLSISIKTGICIMALIVCWVVLLIKMA